MNSRISLLLAFAILVLGGVCVYQARRTSQQKQQVAELQRQIERKAGSARGFQSGKQNPEHPPRDLPDRSAPGQNLTMPPTPAAVLPSNSLVTASAPQTEADRATGDKGGLGPLIAKMMQDPDTKKFIQEQQRLALDQLYAPLVKQLGLNPEETEKFKALLSENAGKAMEKASSLFGSSSNRTEMLATAAAEAKAHEAQVKDLLGESRYAQYQDYQQTAGERMQLNLFRQQMGPDGMTDQQVEDLLGLMKQEKQALSSAGQPVPGINQDGKLQTMLSEDQSEQMLANQEGISQRVYERAKTVLSPEQLNQFGKFQTNQLQMMRMGMSMARKFLGPDGGGAPATPAP